MTELERLEKHLKGKWFIWYRKNSKNQLYAKFTDLGYMSCGINYNPRTKRFSRFKIRDIYQLKKFTHVEDKETMKEIQRVYDRWSLKITLRKHY